MSVRILFGPVSAAFADQNLHHARRAGACLAFGPDPGADLVVGPDETWAAVAARFPAGWQPDAVALWLPYTQIPAGMWAAPVPIIGLAADWNLLFHSYRATLNHCDSILVDVPGVEVLRRAGFAHARPANLFGLERAFLEESLPESGRDIDVLFVGNLSAAVQAERAAWLGRLARLADRWHVHIATGAFGADYRALLRRSRVAFNRSIRGECNKRAFEAAACGALLLQEAENREVRDWLAEGAEFVSYNATNLEDRLDHYLRHEDERRRIAEAARAKVQGYGFGALWAQALERLEPEWPAVMDRARQRATDGPLTTPAVVSVPALDALARAEAALWDGQRQDALDQARVALVELDRTPQLPAGVIDAQPWPHEFGVGRVEWEAAAWRHAGDPAAERAAKARLLRWHLHLFAAELADDIGHHYEAALARPDLPATRAALGCALARNNRLAPARGHLAFAVEAQPFDRPAARAFGQVLRELGDTSALEQLAADRRRLAQAAPGLIPEEDWFAAPLKSDDLASVIILCCNEVETTRRCLASVRRHTRPPFELILVDNGSADDTPQLLTEVRAWPEPARVAVIRNDTNRGYPAGVNQGLAAARGRFLVLLNNDTAVTPGWLDGLVRVSLADGGPALAGPVSNNAPPPQHVPAGYQDLAGLDAFAVGRQPQVAGQVLAYLRLTGFCLLIPRPVLDRVGGLDERYGHGFFDDDDLCVRARRAGAPLRVALDVYVHHEGSRTFRALGLDTAALLRDNFERFRQKWGDAEAAPYRGPGAEPAPAPPVAGASAPVFSLVSDPAATANPSRRPRKSVVLMVKNEEANIGDCLRCVLDLFDEAVVIDTGSTDRTKEIAAALGAKVFDFPWVDSFSAARNEGLRRATGDWIFWLDADDRLDDPNRAKLKALLNSLGYECAAYAMKCRCQEAGGPDTVVDHVRLFRAHPGLQWEHRVHEQILPGLRRLGAKVTFSDVEVRHVGYADPAVRQRKLGRDLRLLELEYAEQPDHPFTLFNLGETHKALGRPGQAVPLLERSLALSAAGDSIVRKLHAAIAQCHRALGDPAAAVAACARGRRDYPDDAELLLTEGLARQDGGDLAGAEACLRQLVDGREAGDHFASVADGLRGALGRHFLAAVLVAQKRDAEAEAQWRVSLTAAPGYAPALYGLGELYVRTQRWDLAEQAAAELGDTPAGAALRGRVRLTRREFAAARWVLTEAIGRFPEAVLPRVLLTYTLLQEGKDWAAAERALRELLAVDPQNTEARNNLQVLLTQQGRPGGVDDIVV